MLSIARNFWNLILRGVAVHRASNAFGEGNRHGLEFKRSQ
jgi:hypothetical protein